MIRQMTREDINACVDLVRVNWDKKTAERFLHEAHTAFGIEEVHPYAYRWPPRYYVYESDEGEVIAFAGMMWSWVMHGVMDFIWINVHPNFQNMGIGDKLTQHRIDVAKSEDAKLINLMTVKPRFFYKFGFELVKHIDDWTFMSLKLGELKL